MAESTWELEYITASETSNEAAWLNSFIRDLGVISNTKEPMKIFYENEGVISLTKEFKFMEGPSISIGNTIISDIGLTMSIYW